MKNVLFFVLFGLELIAPIKPKKTDEQIAIELLNKDDYYVSRADALTMNNPKIREALKEIVLEKGYMFPYQATLFDGGFNQACIALRNARQSRQKSDTKLVVPLEITDK